MDNFFHNQNGGIYNCATRCMMQMKIYLLGKKLFLKIYLKTIMLKNLIKTKKMGKNVYFRNLKRFKSMTK